jgi:hypothetical protein
MNTRSALLSLALLMSMPAAADELSDRICPILEKVETHSAGQAPFAVQANLVMEVAGAYDFKPEALQNVLANVDAATTAACPKLRESILKQLQMDSLQSAMR